MAKKMIIKIMPDGRVVAETDGVKGPECEAYAKKLESIINGKIVKTERKPEYYTKNEDVIVERDKQKIEIDGE